VIASPNFGDRRVSLIVLHHTGDPNFNSALDTLTRRGSEVSAHYLISRDGRIVQLVDERRRAWHAGVARWGPFDDVNSLSIGIELDNDGRSPFADPQIASLIALLHDLIKRYGIDPRNVVGHGDVAPGRKDDPSVMFPWDRLAAAGIGLWCAEPPADAEVALDEPATLQDIGYPINYESDAVAARAAFRRHFLGSEAIGPLSSHERAILLCIAHQQAETPRP
jgi:N-acetylmuramoyl-L-alanine amidase